MRSLNDETRLIVNLELAISELLKEVQRENFTKNSIIKSKLALTLTLINMSIKSVPRLNNLFEFSQKAEEKLFNLNRLEEIIDPLELAELYKLSTDRQTQTINFISTILNNIKWSDLEQALLIIYNSTKNTSSGKDKELNNISKEILKIVEEKKRQSNTEINNIKSVEIEVE